MTVVKYNPEIWLESAVRGLKSYLQDRFHEAVKDPAGNFVGNQAFEIVSEFPESDEIDKMPLERTLIHIAIDEIDNRLLGFGDGHHFFEYSPVTLSYEPQEAGEHRINLDVGIWASDRSGGVTARLRAYQILRNSLLGPLATQRLRDETIETIDGETEGCLEIVEFSGGRFIQETVNDIRLFRMIGCSLVVRCFSRTPVDISIPTIEGINQIESIVIDEQLIPIDPRDLVLGKGVDEANIEREVFDEGSGTDAGSKTP